MSFLSKLFRRQKAAAPVPAPTAAPARDVERLSAPFSMPAVQATSTSEMTPSQLGGCPKAAPGFEWPTRDGRPLSFLAGIDLEQLQQSQRVDWLPAAGSLLFFYDVAEQPWGFDPKDRSGWHVTYVADRDDCIEIPFPASMNADERLPHASIAFQSINSLPSHEREPIVALSLTDDEADRFCELQERQYGDKPRHQIGGYPHPVQGDNMELEAQLASHGIYCGDAGADRTPQVKELRAGASEWRLLLQLDSDDRINVMWGDSGILYFWIREADARARQFDRAWLVLQCY